MTANARDPQGAASQEAPPSGLTPPRPQGAATAEYSAEEISRLASIRERLAATTTGPWEVVWVEDGDCYVGMRKDARGSWDRDSSVLNEDDAAFIAHAPDDMAWLLARLDAPRESSHSSGDVERVVRAACARAIQRRAEECRHHAEHAQTITDETRWYNMAAVYDGGAEIIRALDLAALRGAPAASGHYCTASKSACEPCHDAPAAPEPGR